MLRTTPRRSTALALAAVSTTALLAAATATAAAPHSPRQTTVTTTMTDPDDTRGRLDLRSVGHVVSGVRGDRVQVSYRLRTFVGFRDGLLDSPQRELVIELHRTTTRGADRNITVSSNNGTLVATVISNSTRQPIRRVRIERLADDRIQVTGSRRLIGARSYFVTSNYHAGGSARCGWDDGWPVTCQDTVPDAGWIRVDPLGWPDLP